MEEERKECMEQEEIIVLIKSLNFEEIADSRTLCCPFALFPFKK
ncbi:MAG: hypothetical protein SVY10_04930 [Thermodesulfobacteriota bacterium]|nr:hypothetical protein [Thermodesulfobacteriota bacterium]